MTRDEYLHQLREQFIDRHLTLPAWMERLPHELREWLRILYWVFFKPSALHLHLARLAPEAVDEEGRVGLHGLRVPAVRALARRALMLTILFPPTAVGLIGLIALALGIPFNWSAALAGVALGVAFGVAWGVALGVAGGVALGVAGGVTLGVAGGVALGVALGVAGGVAEGVAFGVAFGVAWGVARGVAEGVAEGVAWTVGTLLGAARAPFWALEFPFHQRSLPRSPITWDELPVLPQRGLARRLAEIARDPAAGAFWLSYVARHPYARPAVAGAIAELLRHRPEHFSSLLFHLLRDPQPYIAPQMGLDPAEQRREKDSLFSSKLVLAEAGGVAAIPSPSDALARLLTRPLAVRPGEPYRAAFAALYRLLEAAAPTDPRAFSPERLAAALREAVRATGAVGEPLAEFHHLLCTLEALLQSDPLSPAPPAPPLPSTPAPLLPHILSLLHHLEDSRKAAQAYRAASGELARRDHLNEAQAALDRARLLAAESPDIPQPFAATGLLIVKRWGEAIAAERERLLARMPVSLLDDFYVAGPPLRPEAGRLFVGREEIFRRLEEFWRNPLQKASVVLYGQRRMGKTSILYHVRERLGPAYIPVLADLQGLLSDPHRPIRCDADLWEALMREIARALERHLIPIRSEAGEPMDKFLDRVAPLLEDRSIVLMLDEFEKLEQKMDEGAVSRAFLDHLRYLMQHRRELLLLLAGHHTLRERMGQYWEPLMGVAHSVRVSYLEEEAARRLITDPWDGFRLQYSEDSIRRLLKATGGQPMLLQMACSGVIREVNARMRREGGEAYPTVRPEEIDRALDRLVEEGETYYFDAVWNWLTPEQRDALVKLAAAYRPEAQGWIPWPDVPGVDAGMIQALEEREVLKMDGSRCRFRVELLRRWLAQRLGRAQTSGLHQYTRSAQADHRPK